jgi:hypothetical protein
LAAGALLSFLVGDAVLAAPGPVEIQFNRDIRPILSDTCLPCHGPDQNKRKGKLVLDVREEAIAKGAILPGKPDESELIKRIFTSDEDDLMPPPDSHKTLTSAQKESFRKWIAQGAEYQKHWAYVPPVKPAVPAAQNGIDFLVQKRLSQIGLNPSPEADRRTLARRLSFDLVGLPPSPEDAAVFAKDASRMRARSSSEIARLPHSASEWPWLVGPGGLPTHWVSSDNPRSVWPSRLCHQLVQRDKPFDQFTREQLASDCS